MSENIYQVRRSTVNTQRNGYVWYLWGSRLLITRLEAAESGEGAILPTWTAVDTNNVKTSKELWGQLKTEGWNVDVSALFFHCVFLLT